MGLLSWLKRKLRIKKPIEERRRDDIALHKRGLDSTPMFQPNPRIRDIPLPSDDKDSKAVHNDRSKFFKRRKGQSLEYYKTTKKHTKKEELDDL